MIQAPLTDVGHAIKGAIASIAQDSSGDPKIVTAGATEDGAKVTGYSIDRQGFDSLKLSIPWIAALADTKSISLTVGEQQSSDNSNWDTETAVLAIEVQATSSGGTTEYGVKNLNVNLRNKKRYVRYNITPTLSNTSTDTAIWAAVVELGGAEELPTSD